MELNNPKSCRKCYEKEIYVNNEALDRKYFYCKDCLLDEVLVMYWKVFTKKLPKQLKTEIALEHIRSCEIYYKANPIEKEAFINEMEVDI